MTREREEMDEIDLGAGYLAVEWSDPPMVTLYRRRAVGPDRFVDHFGSVDEARAWVREGAPAEATIDFHE